MRVSGVKSGLVPDPGSSRPGGAPKPGLLSPGDIVGSLDAGYSVAYSDLSGLNNFTDIYDTLLSGPFSSLIVSIFLLYTLLNKNKKKFADFVKNKFMNFQNLIKIDFC